MPDDRRGVWYAVAGVSILFFSFCFWFFRGHTHFLGDGYLLLSLLSSSNPVLNAHEVGESLLHLWLAKALGGNSPEYVLLSYELISCLAGAIFVTVVLWVSSRLFERTSDRLLFVLGLTTGGQALMFFGYVENYSLFCLSFGVTVLLGILATERKVPRWTTVLSLAVTVFFHIFGVTLIPAVIYVFLAGTRFERTIRSISWGAKVLAIGVTAAAGTATLLLMTERSLFFKIALLYPWTTVFTIEGYALFSTAHLTDCLNLMCLLVPGTAVLVAGAVVCHNPRIFRESRYVFLIILALSVLSASFIFEAKLGMPRDWDLFSFPAIPLCAFGFFLMLDGRFTGGLGRFAAILAIALASLSLGARVATQVDPDFAVAQIQDYSRLDRLKSKNGLYNIEKYYRTQGQLAKADSIARVYYAFPDERLYGRIDSLMARGRSAEAIHLGTLAAKLNPMSSRAYQAIGNAYFQADQPGPAVASLDTALGLNPHSPTALTILGAIRWQQRRAAEGAALLREAIQTGPQMALPHYYLAQIYAADQKFADQLAQLLIATSKSDATPEMFIDLGDAYLKLDQIENAAKAYTAGKKAGLDLSQISAQLRQHPQLHKYLFP